MTELSTQTPLKSELVRQEIAEYDEWHTVLNEALVGYFERAEELGPEVIAGIMRAADIEGMRIARVDRTLRTRAEYLEARGH